MKQSFFMVFLAGVLSLVPLTTYAAGPHDGLTCTGCHGLHTAKSSTDIFAVEANSKDMNPRTKQPYGGITALCLGCHETQEKGGQDIKPIGGHSSHPYGLTSVNPKVARVPNDLLRNGRFECVSCHDPHPSNTNYKYLRVDTNGGAKMELFCAVCHPMKVDPKEAVVKERLFNSMDETTFNDSPRTASTADSALAKKRQ